MSLPNNSCSRSKVRLRTRRRVLLKALIGLGASSALYGSLDLSAWRSYEAVEEMWIRDRHELLLREAPAAAAAATLDLDAKLADLKKRSVEFRFLLGRDSSLLHGGIWQMTSLQVPVSCQRDIQALPEYRRQLDLVKKLTDSLRHHPQYSVFQRAQTRLWKTPEYREIHRRYMGRMQELQRTWGGSTAPSLSTVDNQ